MKIWTDSWIPKAWSRRVITPRGACLLTNVSELICPVTGQWDEALIQDIFWPEDVKYILQIPLREGVEDFIAWHFDGKGKHSVRCAYKLHVQIEKEQKGRSAGTSTMAAIENSNTNLVVAMVAQPQQGSRR